MSFSVVELGYKNVKKYSFFKTSRGVARSQPSFVLGKMYFPKDEIPPFIVAGIKRV